MTEHQLFINGEYRPAISGKMADDENPASGETYARVHQAGTEDVAVALDAAADAFKSWSKERPSVREAVFLKAARVLEARKAEIMDVLIDEAGSTLMKAGYEVTHTPLHMISIAGECRRVHGSTYWSDYPGVESYYVRRPLGVCVSISPFNFPLLLANRKIGWAMAAGNTVILKPSEVTPVIALKLAEIYTEAGLPAGVLNVLPAEAADLGDSLIADPRVKKVNFTGSSRVGHVIGQQCGKYRKKVTLEMGGKNPLVILQDADVDYAVEVATFSNFMHQGQVCMTGSRVIVEAPIYEEFVDRFAERVAGLPWGDPRTPGVMVGPLIRKGQVSFIHEQVQAAINDGARVVAGGEPQDRHYLPTVVADVTSDMSIFHTECFGPVASVIRADDHEHALALANDSEYGLTSAVLTNDLEKSTYFVDNFEAGMVHVNGPTIRDEPVAPFGGVKNSGTGREGGEFSMEAFTELKWVTIQRGQQQFPLPKKA